MKGTCIGTGRLYQRGWTKSLTERFLPRPHRTRANPVNPSSPPMRLYLLCEVERIEATPEFRAALVTSAARVAGAERGHETRRLSGKAA